MRALLVCLRAILHSWVWSTALHTSKWKLTPFTMAIRILGHRRAESILGCKSMLSPWTITEAGSAMHGPIHATRKSQITTLKIEHPIENICRCFEPCSTVYRRILTCGSSNQNQMAEKRRAVEASGVDVIVFPPDEVSAPSKQQRRLAEDRVASLPQGANLIECDGKSCTHEVAWPPGSTSATTLPPPASHSPPARTYPFKIDPFQQTAVNALEAGDGIELHGATVLYGGRQCLTGPCRLSRPLCPRRCPHLSGEDRRG